MDPALLLAGLDGDQQRAVCTESTLVAVIAGAGSGKTRVLTHRVAHRIALGNADEAHTLVLTFTRQAAGELRRRLPRLGVGSRVTAGTFHSVAHRLLQQRWRDLDRQPPTLTPDRRRILGRLAERGADVEAIATEIDWAAARGLTPAGYELAVRHGERSPTVTPSIVVDIFDRYRTEQRRAHIIDLDDLLSNTIAALDTDQGFADRLLWQFRHILVDEAQDLNPLQHRLIDRLNAGRNDLFLVGDPAQAIYGFNGADPTLLVDVSTRFPGVEVIRLAANHRSTPQVVAAGRAVLPADTAVTLRSTRDDGVEVRIQAVDDEHAEASATARLLAGVDPMLVRGNHVAVLARTNAQLALIASALAGAGLPVRPSSGHDASKGGAPIGLVYRLGDAHALRTWAQDAVEGSDPDTDPSELPGEVEVGRVVLDYLRTNPTGDGVGFRAWVESTDPFGSTEAGIELLTFHAAKGREWHTVVLVGCETSLVPHRTATTTAARAEEARLLYVAITRATDALHVFWARRRGGYQRRLTPLLEGFESTAPTPIPRPRSVVLTEPSARERVIDQLRQWRASTARVAGAVPESICTDAALAAIADALPDSPEALDAATGLGVLTARRLFPGIAAALHTAVRDQSRSTITGA